MPTKAVRRMQTMSRTPVSQRTRRRRTMARMREMRNQSTSATSSTSHRAKGTTEVTAARTPVTLREISG